MRSAHKNAQCVWIGGALLGVLTAAALAQPAHAELPPGSTAPAGYQLVFSDDFDGTALNTSTWGTRQSSWVSDDNVGPLTPHAHTTTRSSDVMKARRRPVLPALTAAAVADTVTFERSG
ncbi:hypothetical protein [Streptomyces sp. NPDC057301]|uniref:hypothetical protein n=1 Tax=Streptomyces sp. NPDC057301 TaxID=3346093 RepID=UPI0036438A28